jgi:23S rRNA (cytosine1962-C5)-methyltransferase
VTARGGRRSIGQPVGRPVARLAKPLAAAIRGGHPWVYDRALPRLPPVSSGEVVTLVDDSGAIACAVADPGSPNRARVLDLDPDAVIDGAWVRGRVRAAVAARLGDPTLTGATGLRLVHGENDFCPGLVVDLYGGVAVVVVDGAGADGFWRPALAAVLDGLREGGVDLTSAWLRPVRGSGEGKGEVLVGAVPELVEIEEHGARFAVDVRRGQKTGFFLDQRANRQVVRAHAAGLDVLNLFSYTGGFSVHAALGGARRVTSVDIAAPAIAAAQDNFQRSGVAPAAHGFHAVDAFEFLTRAAAEGRRWDLVIVDPPSFAPSEKARGKAMPAYTRLAGQGLAVTAPGGLFCLASCSSHVTEVDLLGCLADAAGKAGRRVRARMILGAASDHPVLPGFPEGRYLKFFLCDAG